MGSWATQPLDWSVIGEGQNLSLCICGALTLEIARSKFKFSFAVLYTVAKEVWGEVVKISTEQINLV